MTWKKPFFRSKPVKSGAVKRIESGEYDVIILNFANCDMVGHTGVYEAARFAVETVDECVQKVVEATQKMGGVALITAMKMMVSPSPISAFSAVMTGITNSSVTSAS